MLGTLAKLNSSRAVCPTRSNQSAQAKGRPLWTFFIKSWHQLVVMKSKIGFYAARCFGRRENGLPASYYKFEGDQHWAERWAGMELHPKQGRSTNNFTERFALFGKLQFKLCVI